MTEQSLKFVYSVNASNIVEKHVVSLGGAVGTRRIVRSGLQPTDRVVINGLQRIMMPGMPVKPIAPPKPAAEQSSR